ncbi:MAG: hypothetical protein ACK5QT_02585, partial [Oligoflexia bacterium]
MNSRHPLLWDFLKLTATFNLCLGAALMGCTNSNRERAVAYRAQITQPSPTPSVSSGITFRIGVFQLNTSGTAPSAQIFFDQTGQS